MEICGIEEAIKTLNELKEIFSSPDPFKDDKDYDRAIAIETLLTAYEKEKEMNKRLRKCHLQYEEMTGIDLLLPSKEE